jgi:hypothetical protein
MNKLNLPFYRNVGHLIYHVHCCLPKANQHLGLLIPSDLYHTILQPFQIESLKTLTLFFCPNTHQIQQIIWNQEIYPSPLIFALFHLPSLKNFWKTQLRENYIKKLNEVIPFAWLITDEPLNLNGVIPQSQTLQWPELIKERIPFQDYYYQLSQFNNLQPLTPNLELNHVTKPIILIPKIKNELIEISYQLQYQGCSLQIHPIK